MKNKGKGQRKVYNVVRSMLRQQTGMSNTRRPHVSHCMFTGTEIAGRKPRPRVCQSPTDLRPNTTPAKLPGHLLHNVQAPHQHSQAPVLLSPMSKHCATARSTNIGSLHLQLQWTFTFTLDKIQKLSIQIY